MLGEAIDRYAEEELVALAATERLNREQKLAWWRHRLGEVELRQISRDLPRRLLARLADGSDAPNGRPVTFATCNRYKAALSAVLSAAVDWEWLESNPLHSSSRRRRPNSQRERERNREITAEELQRLLHHYRQSDDPRLYPLALLARASGAREGELMRLRWEDADLSAEPPRVEVHDTKSGGESRMLYFPGVAGDELRRLAARPHRSGYVFGEPDALHRDGPPKFPRMAFRYWTQRSGVPDVWFHDLRHAWACHLLDEGVGLAQLMILGGWKSVAMVRRYAQRAQRNGNRALEAVGRTLLPAPAGVLAETPSRL
jgi:integrase